MSSNDEKILYKMTDKKTDDVTGYMIYCQGCKCCHVFDGRWSFNGNFEKPTFSPSLLVKRNYGANNEKQVCHSFVRDGKIQYLSDCTHDLAGQTLDLEKF